MTPKQKVEHGRCMFNDAMQLYIHGAISRTLCDKIQQAAVDKMNEGERQMVDGVL